MRVGVAIAKCRYATKSINIIKCMIVVISIIIEKYKHSVLLVHVN